MFDPFFVHDSTLVTLNSPFNVVKSFIFQIFSNILLLTHYRNNYVRVLYVGICLNGINALIIKQNCRLFLCVIETSSKLVDRTAAVSQLIAKFTIQKPEIALSRRNHFHLQANIFISDIFRSYTLFPRTNLLKNQI